MKQKEIDRLNSWSYKLEQAERNRALNAAWDELIELFPGCKELHPHLPERPSPGIIISY